MLTLNRLLITVSMCCLVWISGCASLTHEDAINARNNATAAYNRGDYAQALKIVRPLAEQGNAQAQNNTEGNHRGNERLQQDRNKVTSESYL